MLSHLSSRTLLFDLDGTLTDPQPGITRCIQDALSKLGYPSPAPEELSWCIGPPLQQSFAELLQTADQSMIQRAVALYRDRYASIGLFENRVYPAIPDLLESLRLVGYRILIATSKPQVYAQRIVEHFALSEWVDRVYGSELDGTRSQKGELIRYILQTEQIAAVNAVMIGDRKHDMIGASQNQVWAIGVTYGYGTREELETHGAGAIVDTPQQISLLLSGVP